MSEAPLAAGLPPAAPSLPRRLACVLYESLLLLAVLFVAAFPLVALTQHLPPALGRNLLQAYLFLIAGCYFTLFWRKGQTLAMKTWGMRMESTRGGPLGLGQAWLRYLLAGANLALAGVGWWGALFTPDRQFLHDRLAGTRLVASPNAAPATRSPPARPG